MFSWGWCFRLGRCGGASFIDVGTGSLVLLTSALGQLAPKLGIGLQCCLVCSGGGETNG